jgi:hypothetical protein
MRKGIVCGLLALVLAFGAGSLLTSVRADLGVLCGVGCQNDRNDCVRQCGRAEDPNYCRNLCLAGYEGCWISCGLPITVLP